jgi:hypothetical protein
MIPPREADEAPPSPETPEAGDDGGPPDLEEAGGGDGGPPDLEEAGGDDGHGRDSRGLSARPWLMEGRFKDRDSDDSDDSDDLDRPFVTAGGSVPGPAAHG